MNITWRALRVSTPIRDIRKIRPELIVHHVFSEREISTGSEMHETVMFYSHVAVGYNYSRPNRPRVDDSFLVAVLVATRTSEEEGVPSNEQISIQVVEFHTKRHAKECAPSRKPYVELEPFIASTLQELQ